MDAALIASVDTAFETRSRFRIVAIASAAEELVPFSRLTRAVVYLKVDVRNQ
jgi:hypothetical protein